MWDLVTVSPSVVEKEFTENVFEVDENGIIVEKTVTVIKKVLLIDIQYKEVVDVSASYSFSLDEKDILNELLLPEYSVYYKNIVDGVSNA